MRAPLRLFRMILGYSRLRRITYAGRGLGLAQGGLLAYYPVILIDHVGYSFAAAGMAFALLQVLGRVGRIFPGWLSDQVARERAVLSWLCIASGGTILLIAMLGPGSPLVLIAALSALAGVTVVSGNGVFSCPCWRHPGARAGWRKSPQRAHSCSSAPLSLARLLLNSYLRGVKVIPACLSLLDWLRLSLRRFLRVNGTELLP